MCSFRTLAQNWIMRSSIARTDGIRLWLGGWIRLVYELDRPEGGSPHTNTEGEASLPAHFLLSTGIRPKRTDVESRSEKWKSKPVISINTRAEWEEAMVLPKRKREERSSHGWPGPSCTPTTVPPQSMCMSNRGAYPADRRSKGGCKINRVVVVGGWVSLLLQRQPLWGLLWPLLARQPGRHSS